MRSKFITLVLGAALVWSPALAFPDSARADGPGKIDGAFQRRFGGEVNLSGATDGQAAVWDAATRRWIPGSGGSGGVSSITGTANQVVASGSTGAITLSLPQSIATGSSPTFNALTLATPLVVGGGGTGVATIGSNKALQAPLNGSTGAPLWRVIDLADLTGVSLSGGDLQGTLSAPTVAFLRGRQISTTAPTDGQIYAWSAATSQFVPTTPSSGGSQNLDSVLTTGNSTTHAIQFTAGSSSIHGPTAPDVGAGSTNSLVFDSNSGNGASFGIGGAAYGAFLTGPIGTLVDPAPTIVAGGSAYAGHYAAPVQIIGGIDQENSLDSASGDVQILTGGLADHGLEVSRYGDVAPMSSSSLAQNATHGFWFVPRCATGAPSGTPTGMFPGAAAVVVGGNHHLYVELTTGTFSQIDGGGGVSDLQGAYAGGAAIAEAGGVPVAISSTTADNAGVLTLSKSPAGEQSGAVAAISLGTHAFGAGLTITNSYAGGGDSGVGLGINMGAGTDSYGESVTLANGRSGGGAFLVVGGTQTNSNPVLHATQTWNNSGAAFEGITLNVTNTASAATSTLLDLQVGGASKLALYRTGGLTLGAPTGGDKGPGTVNAAGLYVNGASVSGSSFDPTAVRVRSNSSPTVGGVCMVNGNLWATDGIDSVSVIDPASRVVTHRITCGSVTNGLCYDGTYVWVCNFGTTTVTQITASTFTVANTVTVGSAPYNCVSDGTYVWVANYTSGTVSQITIASHTVANTVTVGTHPTGICWDGAAFIWVSNSGSTTVSQITISSHTVANTVTVGTTPQGCSSDGTSVWVANYGSNTLSRITISSHTVAATTTIGPSNTDPASVLWDGTYVWVGAGSGGPAWPLSAALWKIDPATDAIIAQYPVTPPGAGSIYSLCYDSADKLVWAGDDATGLVIPFKAQ